MKGGIEAVLEISILIVSIFAIGYVLGDEFRLVSAGDTDTTCDTVKATKKCGVEAYVGNTKCIGQKCENNAGQDTGPCIKQSLSQQYCCKKICPKDVAPISATNTQTTNNYVPTIDTLTNAITFTNMIKNTNPESKKVVIEKKDMGGFKEDCGKTIDTPLGICMTKSACEGKGTVVVGHCAGSLYCCVPTPTGQNPQTWNVPPAPTFEKNPQAAGWNILGNAGIALILYVGINKIGVEMFHADEQFINNLAADLFWGYGLGGVIGSFAASMGMNEWITNTGLNFFGVWIPGAGLVGMGIAGLFFVIFEKQYSYDTVIFNCNSWQPATGWTKCEQCNKGLFPCTKYKCQSLGQSCELVNEGTGNELCVGNNRNDISPPKIRAWNGTLSAGYKYIPDDAALAPDTGVIIKYLSSSDGCAPPFTTLKYGVALDKPGQCKVDTVRKIDYDSMGSTASSGMFKYNHTLISYAGGINTSEQGLSFANGGDYEVYVRCQSKNGYSNVGTFVFKYCVSDEPDSSAPAIIATDPINGNPVAFGQTDKDVNIYVNKPSECRWSHDNVDFDVMSETMTPCTTSTTYNANLVFKCSTTLTGLKDGVSNNFYIRCKSYPGSPKEDRYKNVESYKYTLVGTRPLVLDWVKPNGTTIKDSTTSVNVTLEAHTSAGYKEGLADCYYKNSSQSDANYVLFFATNSFQHSQVLWLETGSYSYDIKCCDLGGNCETAPTEFEVETDTAPPMVIRIYNDNNKLKIVTDEKAECVYSTTDCNYLFADGLKLTTSNNLEHLAEWNTASNIYIKCQDEFGNQPFPNACSITVRPFSEYTTSSATA